MERQLLHQIEMGPYINGEPTSCLLLYEIGGEFNIVVIDKENGDAEIYLTAEQFKKLADVMAQASKGL